jgi:hypothetical protein
MGPFLQPYELNQIRRDFNDLMNGLDGCEVIVRWLTNPGPRDPVYDDDQTGVLTSLTTRGVMNIFKAKDIKRLGFADVLEGDGVLMLRKSVDLAGKDALYFEVTGLGNFTPQTMPPSVAAQYAMLFPNAEQFVQWVFLRPKR